MISSLIWCDLIDYYKKGSITLKGEENFGENNDWEGLFYDPYKEMIVAPDGSIFVANNRQHNIYKFDKNGNFLKMFGRKGQGPGDFDSPGDMTILDNEYLMVGEYASNRRITIWDLEGKCIKVVKT
jgi:DNA-binding beta-propeller fold protein YncE